MRAMSIWLEDIVDFYVGVGAPVSSPFLSEAKTFAAVIYRSPTTQHREREQEAASVLITELHRLLRSLQAIKECCDTGVVSILGKKFSHPFSNFEFCR